MSETVTVTIEGKQLQLDPARDYTGSELRALGGVGDRDKLVLEETDGTETAVPPSGKLRLSANANLFVSHRHRRGY
jgi:hypothetical protein